MRRHPAQARGVSDSLDSSGPGEALRGKAQPPPELGWGHTWCVAGAGIVPPFPGVTLIPLATPPPPRQLDGAETMDEWVAYVLATYANGWGRYWPRGAKGKPYSHKDVAGRGRKRLEAACWMFFNEEIPPAMWIRFCFDRWMRDPPDGVNPKRTPPMWATVLRGGASRVELGWFRRESSTYGAASAVMGLAHRELLRRHNAMTAALMQCHAEAPDAMARVVGEYFPRGAWEAMVAGAQREARAQQDRFDYAAKQGEWPWR